MDRHNILVTGGTGSFGHYFVDTIYQKYPNANIIVFSRDEFKQHEMQKLYPNINFMIGDIRDKSRINEAMKDVQYVFHAAALKHVPNCEKHPTEAIKTNILGSTNVLEAALNNRVHKLVILSTDKAVYPINVMGMSKAIMEKQMISYAKRAAGLDVGGFTLGEKFLPNVFCGVRYGNVMCSRGSVIPHFINLIKNNKPITITDPTMTRFLLSLSDAIDLVLYAFDNAKPGEMFIRKAPATTILNIAKALYVLLHKEEDITITGIRPGEKKHETLVTEEEMINAIEYDNYYKIPNNDPSYKDYYLGIGEQDTKPSYTSQSEELDLNDTIKLLLTLKEIEEVINV